MENYIRVSNHINRQIVYFGTFFSDVRMSREECLQFSSQSSLLHRNLVDSGDLTFYDEHIELARITYGLMLRKVKNQQMLSDILFCGSSERSWEETRALLLDLYEVNMHSKEIHAFYYLHEINNMSYIDSPLPTRNSASI